jgi:ABC-type nickel/cobalt efflux system permease component RcnA
MSGVSAAIHALLSLLLGLLAVAIGAEAAARLGHGMEAVGGILLIAFGIAYAVWSFRKGGHFHPGGALVHRHEETGACDGAEGASAEHLHYHADAALIERRKGRSDLSLAVIVGINPCVLILPLLFAAASDGAPIVLATAAAYSATTIVLMVALSVAGVAGLRFVRVPAIARHMEAASGLLIALLGVVVWAFGH